MDPSSARLPDFRCSVISKFRALGVDRKPTCLSLTTLIRESFALAMLKTLWSR
jgi:hypothetical protein